jgi:hypothetical protein
MYYGTTTSSCSRASVSSRRFPSVPAWYVPLTTRQTARSKHRLPWPPIRESRSRTSCVPNEWARRQPPSTGSLWSCRCYGSVSCFEVCGVLVMRWRGWGHFMCLPRGYPCYPGPWYLHGVSYPQTTPSHPIWAGGEGGRVSCVVVGKN